MTVSLGYEHVGVTGDLDGSSFGDGVLKVGVKPVPRVWREGGESQGGEGRARTPV